MKKEFSAAEAEFIFSETEEACPDIETSWLFRPETFTKRPADESVVSTVLSWKTSSLSWREVSLKMVSYFLVKIQSTPEFRDIYRHPIVQQILSDKETIRQIQSTDITKLLRNPKILALWQDEELVKKMMKLGGGIVEKASSKESSPSDTAEPK